MQVDKNLILKLGDLAKLELSDEDVEDFVTDLSKVIQYVDQLSEVDEKGQPEENKQSLWKLYHLDRYDSHTPLRDDQEKSHSKLSLEEKLQNAPKKTGSQFEVPAII